MKIERAIPTYHTSLTTITKQSKGIWGYSVQQMADWDEALTILPKYIAENETLKLVSGKKIIGYYSVLKIDAKILKLDNFFILPEAMGQGCGSLLLTYLFEKASEENFDCITLDADPNAEAFYLKFGFSTVGQVETSTPGRYLPQMIKLL